jgi:hypothetical protein
MSKEVEYRQNAAETFDLAQNASSTRDKGRLLSLAEKWLDLAERAHSATKRHAAQLGDHPLVRAKLGRGQPEAE